MFTGDEKEGKTLAFLVAGERETRVVLSIWVPRNPTGERIRRRLMAWRRWVEVCGYKREIRQRTITDEFD